MVEYVSRVLKVMGQIPNRLDKDGEEMEGTLAGMSGHALRFCHGLWPVVLSASQAFW